MQKEFIFLLFKKQICKAQMFYLTILFFVTIVHASTKIIASDRITLKRPFLICDKSKLHECNDDECNDKE